MAALDPDGNPFAGRYVPDLCLSVAEILSDVEEATAIVVARPEPEVH